MVTSAFLFEDSFPEDIPFNKMITVSATLFLFFFGNYLMNFMSADLIVYSKPPVLIGYEGVLERVESGKNVSVIFLPGLPETLRYQEAPEGTFEAKMWQLQKPAPFKDGVMELVIALKDPVIRQEAVAMMREVIINAVTATAFMMTDDIR